tara:strand:- start:1162 stop:2355 length:1194 start_codon:yes stop_codon:yes gene_type:complete
VKKKILKDNSKYIIGNYSRYPISIVNGDGSYVYDSESKKYLDFISGIAVNNLGHNNKKVNNAINKQLKNLVHISNLFVIPNQVNFAKEIVKNKPGHKVFFCNSGTEANEAAFKISRKWGIFNNKKTIVSFTGGFHGRTFGSLTATWPKKYKEGFYPLVPGFKTAEFNDIESFEKIIKKDKKILAVIVEPIQGEAGVILGLKNYLKKLEKICKENNILLIFDEVQVGIGRTGKIYCHEHFDIKPDIFTLAKAIGGGLPVGAVVASPKVADFLTPGSHGTTMGGNPLAMAAGMASFKQINTKPFLSSVKDKGNYFLQELKKLSRNTNIKEVRGLGLILAIEFFSSESAKKFANLCLKKGLLILLTEKVNIRILPPLNVKKLEIDKAIKIFKNSLEDLNA